MASFTDRADGCLTQFLPLGIALLCGALGAFIGFESDGFLPGVVGLIIGLFVGYWIGSWLSGLIIFALIILPIAGVLYLCYLAYTLISGAF